MFKIIFITIMIFAGYSTAYAQQPGNIIDYIGGRKQLDKTIAKYLGGHKGLFDDAMQPDSLRKSNKYYTVFMQIDKNGIVDNDIMVNACNDTTVTAIIAAAVRQTSGQWINNSGSDKWVVLPIYYLYKDDGVPGEKIPLIKGEVYASNGRSPVVYLDKLEIVLFPMVH